MLMGKQPYGLGVDYVPHILWLKRVSADETKLHMCINQKENGHFYSEKQAPMYLQQRADPPKGVGRGGVSG